MTFGLLVMWLISTIHMLMSDANIKPKSNFLSLGVFAVTSICLTILEVLG